MWEYENKDILNLWNELTRPSMLDDLVAFLNEDPQLNPTCELTLVWAIRTCEFNLAAEGGALRPEMILRMAKPSKPEA